MNLPGSASRALQIALFATGLLAFYLLPMWAGIFATVFEFSSAQIGTLLTADMATGTLASFTARYWIHRVRWRPVIALSVASAAALNLACVEATQYWQFLALRCGAGFATGAMLAFPYAAFAASRNPDRLFSIALAVQVAVAAVTLAAASWLMGTFGFQAVFALTALLTALPLAFIKGCPDRSPGVSDAEQPAKVGTDLGVTLALAAIALFMMALTGVWAFVESIADGRSSQSQLVGAVLASTLLFSFFGALAPALLGASHHQRLPIPGAYCVLALAVAGLGVPGTAIIFAVSMVLYQFFFSFVMPLQAAWVAEADTLGRNAVLVPVAQGVGAALGPLSAGLIAGQFGSQAIIYLSLLLLICSYACVVAAGARQLR